MFDGMTNRDNYWTVQWNSSRPGFHLKIDFFNSCIDLILYRKSRNYWNAILLNLKMFLSTWWPFFFAITKDIVLFKIYFKSLVFPQQNAVFLRFEIVSDISVQNFQCNTSYYHLDIAASFFNYTKIPLLWIYF